MAADAVAAAQAVIVFLFAAMNMFGLQNMYAI